MYNRNIERLKEMFPRLKEMKFVVVESTYVPKSQVTLGKDIFYININSKLTKEEKEESLINSIVDMLLHDLKNTSEIKKDILHLINMIEEENPCYAGEGGVKVGDSVIVTVSIGKVIAGNQYEMLKL